MNPIGHFRGLSLIQTKGNVGGYKNVFVNLVGNHNDLVYPHIGGKVMNPPKGQAKMWAGDLLEYRPTGHPNNLDPEIYILRTFKLAAAVSTTVYIERDEFKHKPFVGDVLMVEPDVIGGTGTAVTVTAVSATTTTVDSATVNVWQLTVSAALTADKGKVLVEAEEAGSDKKMLVKNINGVFDCDADFVYDENISDVANTSGVVTDGMNDFYKARYQYTPALGGLMWIDKMSPLPQCVLDLNLCNVPGWYHINWALSGKKVNAGVEAAAEVKSEYFLTGASDPTTSTAAPVGAVYVSSTDGGVFHCTAIDTSGDTPSYTWTEMDVKA